MSDHVSARGARIIDGTGAPLVFLQPAHPGWSHRRDGTELKAPTARRWLTPAAVISRQDSLTRIAMTI
jgi:hypothetical protein